MKLLAPLKNKIMRRSKKYEELLEGTRLTFLSMNGYLKQLIV